MSGVPVKAQNSICHFETDLLIDSVTSNFWFLGILKQCYEKFSHTYKTPHTWMFHQVNGIWKKNHTLYYKANTLESGKDVAAGINAAPS